MIELRQMQFGEGTREVMAGNATGRARSAVWVGEIQVEHRLLVMCPRAIM